MDKIYNQKVEITSFIPQQVGALAVMDEKQFNHSGNKDNFTNTYIPIVELVSNQVNCTVRQLKDAVRVKPKDMHNTELNEIEVVRFAEVNYVRMGTHYVIAAILKGKDRVMCKFVDVDNI